MPNQFGPAGADAGIINESETGDASSEAITESAGVSSASAREANTKKMQNTKRLNMRSVFVLIRSEGQGYLNAVPVIAYFRHH